MPFSKEVIMNNNMIMMLEILYCIAQIDGMPGPFDDWLVILIAFIITRNNSAKEE